MADYLTTYLFRIDIEGKAAVRAASKLRLELAKQFAGSTLTSKEVGVLKTSYDDLRKVTDLAGKSITSITRRMTYQRKGMKETEASVLSLGTHYQTLLQMMTQEATEPFAAMVEAAQAAKEKLVGNSIIPDMVMQAVAHFQLLRSYGMETFEAIAMAARAAAGVSKASFSEVMDLSVRGVAAAPLGPSIADPDVLAIGPDPWANLAPEKLAALAVGTEEIEDATEKILSFSDAINKATIAHFGLRRIGYGLAYSGRVIARAGEELTGALMGAAEEYLVFERNSALAGIAMEMQADQLEGLREEVLAMSAAYPLFDPEQLLQGVRQWGAGTGVVVRTQKELNAVMLETLDIQKMAALNNANLGKSIDVVGGVMHEFGLETSDVTHITEVLNYVAAKTFANVLDVGDAFKMVGPIASQLGVSMEEVAVTIGLLSDANIKGSRAGRAIRQMFQRLLKPTREYDAMMQDLLRSSLGVGESWKELIMPNGVFVGMTEYFNILAEATENYTSAERAAVLATLATANELPALAHVIEEVIQLRREGVNLIEDELALLLDAHGLMQRSFELLEQQESYRVDKMKARWNAATLKMGEAVQENMLPYMEDWYDWITKIVEELAENEELLKWASLAGFGLQGVGKAVGGTGEAVNIAANIAIMMTAVKEFGGIPKILNRAGVAILGLTAKVPALFVALAGGKALASILAGLEREKEIPLDIQEIYASGTRLPFPYLAREAESPEMKKAFSAIFGEEWMWNTSANIDKVYAHLLEQQQRVATALPVALPTTSTTAMPMMPIPGYEITNEAEALMQYLQYLEEVDSATESYYQRREAMIDAHTDKEWAAQEAYLRKEEERTLQYYRALERAAEDQQNRLMQLHGRYTTTMLAAMETYQRKLADLLEDYTAKESRHQQDVTLKRSDLEEDYRRKELEASEAFQRKLRRSEADHLETMNDLIRTRDARGVLLEVQRYRRTRTEAQEDYGIARSRRLQDFVERQTELADSYALQKQRRLAAYQERLSDLTEDHARQKAERLASYEARRVELEKEYTLRSARRIEDYELQREEAQEAHDRALAARKESLAEQLATQEEAWKEQLVALTEAEQEKLAALIEAETRQEKYLREHYDTLLADFREFLSDYDTVWQDFLDTPAPLPVLLPILLKKGTVKPGGPPPAYYRWERTRLPEGLQEGGYAYAGTYQLGEVGREFILNAATTRAAERQLGAPLGQASFGRGGGGGVVVEQSNWQFHGSFTDADKQWFRQAAKEAAYEGILEVVSG